MCCESTKMRYQVNLIVAFFKYSPCWGSRTVQCHSVIRTKQSRGAPICNGTEISHVLLCWNRVDLRWHIDSRTRQCEADVVVRMKACNGTVVGAVFENGSREKGSSLIEVALTIPLGWYVYARDIHRIIGCIEHTCVAFILSPLKSVMPCRGWIELGDSEIRDNSHRERDSPRKPCNVLVVAQIKIWCARKTH